MIDPYSQLRQASDPSPKDLLAFLLAAARSQNLGMDGLSTWYFPSNLLFKHRSRTAYEALVAAYQTSLDERYDEKAINQTVRVQ